MKVVVKTIPTYTRIRITASTAEMKPSTIKHVIRFTIYPERNILYKVTFILRNVPFKMYTLLVCLFGRRLFIYFFFFFPFHSANLLRKRARILIYSAAEVYTRRIKKAAHDFSINVASFVTNLVPPSHRSKNPELY